MNFPRSLSQRFLELAISALIVISSAAAAFAASAPPTPADLRAGFAERDITPALGSERPGGYGKAWHTRFHDPCKVRAPVFEAGQGQVAIVSVDALFVPRPVVDQARAAIAQRTGLAAGAIMIAATHSHSSGPVGMVQPGQYDDAPTDIRTLAYEDATLADAKYLQRVTDEIVQAVRLAHAARVAVELGFGVGHEDQAAFNRRMRMKHGETWTLPGSANPDIVDYAGPIDPAVGVIGAWDRAGKLVGSIVNFSCHATTNPGGTSANWIYYLERTLHGALATRAPVLFLAGACGDVGQVDSKSRNEYRSGEDWAHFIGGRVGAEAVKVLLSVPRTSKVTLEARQRSLTFQRRAPSANTVAQARSIIAAGKRPPDLTDWLFARETLMLTHLLRIEPRVDVELQAIQLGPAVIVSNPAEYFVQSGLDIKRGSRFPFTFVAELTNGGVGYVPPEEAFSATGGGYETRLTSYSNLEPTAATQMAAASIALVNELTPGSVPEFPRISAPGKPWPYGNVAPQID